MQTITDYLTAIHHVCDQYLIDAEEAASQRNPARLRTQFTKMRQAVEGHMRQEEEILFPELGNIGPVAAMLRDHVQMRSLLDEMERAHADQAWDHYLGLSDTLLILIQQHNIKEEHILYPMCDDALEDIRDRLLENMKSTAAGVL